MRVKSTIARPYRDFLSEPVILQAFASCVCNGRIPESVDLFTGMLIFFCLIYPVTRRLSSSTLDTHVRFDPILKIMKVSWHSIIFGFHNSYIYWILFLFSVFTKKPTAPSRFVYRSHGLCHGLPCRGHGM